MLFFFYYIAFTSCGRATELQRCVRPSDFSVAASVGSYENCLGRQEAFCRSHPEETSCTTIVHSSGKPYFKVPMDEVDPAKRCRVLKDGSYKCLQDPVRIVATSVGSTEAPTTPTPAASPQGAKMPQVPLDGEGAESPAPVPITPPPPKK